MSKARNSHSFLYNHKWAIAVSTLNLVSTGLDHVWMASSDSYSLGWKLTYMLAVPLLRSAMWGIVGHGVDIGSAILDQAMTESSPLMQNRV